MGRSYGGFGFQPLRFSAMTRIAVLMSIVLALAAAGCGGSDKKSTTSGNVETTQTAGTPTGPEPKASCKSVKAPKPKPNGGAKKPTSGLDPAGKTTVTMETNCGTFVVDVDPKTSPKAAASFVSLAGQGFYDNTVFHRIVPGFVIQGGDPTGTGQGGPGYTTVDKPNSSARYSRGVVAMAKSGTEPAGAAGSQFFVVTGADATLPPDYAIVGRVSSGEDVTQKIGKLGDTATEKPTQPVVLEKATAKQ
jgi:peptidyl-prolyl cis-trans isomerase B (cyclophilin B)